MQTITHDINLLDYPTLKKITTTHDKEYSLSFIIGFLLLRVYVSCKENEEFFNIYSKQLKDLIIFLKSRYNESISPSVDIYEQIIQNLSTSPESSISNKWLFECINSSYEHSLKSIVDIGYYISYNIVEFKDELISDLLNQRPLKILEYVSLYFQIYIFVRTDSDKFISISNLGIDSYTCFVFYTNNQFYLIHSKDPSKDNEIKMFKYGQSTQNSEYSQDSSNLYDFSEVSQDSCNLNDFPQFLSLLSSMMDEIIEKGLYSKNIRDLLNMAVQEDAEIIKIPAFKKALDIRETFCEDHKINVNLKLSCGNTHCRDCFFDKILKEFSRKNLKIYCDCGKQIPPKEVDALKSTSDYQQFSLRNKRK